MERTQYKLRRFPDSTGCVAHTGQTTHWDETTRGTILSEEHDSVEYYEDRNHTLDWSWMWREVVKCSGFTLHVCHAAGIHSETSLWVTLLSSVSRFWPSTSPSIIRLQLVIATFPPPLRTFFYSSVPSHCYHPSLLSLSLGTPNIDSPLTLAFAAQSLTFEEISTLVNDIVWSWADPTLTPRRPLQRNFSWIALDTPDLSFLHSLFASPSPFISARWLLGLGCRVHNLFELSSLPSSCWYHCLRPRNGFR